MKQMMELCCENRVRLFSVLSIFFGAAGLCMLCFSWSALLFSVCAIFFACFGWKQEEKRWIRVMGLLLGASTWVMTIGVIVYAMVMLQNVRSDYEDLMRTHAELVQDLDERYLAKENDAADASAGDWSVEEYEAKLKRLRMED